MTAERIFNASFTLRVCRGADCCAILGQGKPASTGLSAGFDLAQDRPASTGLSAGFDFAQAAH